MASPFADMAETSISSSVHSSTSSSFAFDPMSLSASAIKSEGRGGDDDVDDPKRRFLLDLEFVQALANPYYLKFLAQHEDKFFEQEEFVAYLKYLTYFHKPDYVKFITYPHCLHILDLIQDEHFRKQIAYPIVLGNLEDQQHLHWSFYQNKRMGLIKEAEDGGDPAAQHEKEVAQSANALAQQELDAMDIDEPPK